MSRKKQSRYLPKVFLPAAVLSCALLILFALAYQARAAVLPERLEPEPVVLRLSPFVTPGQLDRPVDIASAGDSRLFVVERPGRIRIVEADGMVLGAPFLDITDRVERTGSFERGLLGLVFHPDFSNNGYFYVNYTARPDGATRISRFEVTANPNIADPDSELVILTVAQPFANHNAGDLAFGPADGYLYIPLGDGGSGNDPGNRAQDPGELLGKILRVDVDGAGSATDCGSPGIYTIPSDNPFIDGPGGSCDEIWALGLRNPWRFSFDRVTGDMYVGDVGQNDWEEINYQEAGSSGGQNYGWRCYEGTNRNPNIAPCEPVTSHTPPTFEYSHAEGPGCAVTGGFVYRGQRHADLEGRYIFTDYCTGMFWDMAPDGAGGWQVTVHTNLQRFGYVTFGEDASGELYVANISNGDILRVTPRALPELTLFLPVILNGE